MRSPLALALGLAASVAPLCATAQSVRGLVAAPDTVTLDATGAGGAPRTFARALALVRTGGVVIVRPGLYREPTIGVTRSVTIVGTGDAVLDGEGKRQIMTVMADDVTVRGLHFVNPGTSYVEDRAALKVQRARNCKITGNRVDAGFFGIYLAATDGCLVADNVLTAHHRTEGSSGNGIHLWSTRHATIERNVVSGYRDGIYFEFVRQSRIAENTSTHNLRYGLHFMYSDSCSYERNTFRANGAGVAVMYTHRILMEENRFLDNRGPSAYGLLLKEIYDPVLRGNIFAGNTVALVADGATRIRATGNVFMNNGWGIRLLASTEDGRFTGNDFMDNTFDVATNSSGSSNRFDANYWDRYRGYDLNTDGRGDVPFRPVPLFALAVAQNPPAVVLLRSVFVRLLDAAERVIPALTPASVMDSAPSMRPNMSRAMRYAAARGGGH